MTMESYAEVLQRVAYTPSYDTGRTMATAVRLSESRYKQTCGFKKEVSSSEAEVLGYHKHGKPQEGRFIGQVPASPGPGDHQGDSRWGQGSHMVDLLRDTLKCALATATAAQ